jgi:hypothetical protein
MCTVITLIYFAIKRALAGSAKSRERQINKTDLAGGTL